MRGTDGVRVFTLADGWGLDLHRRRALERRVCRLACLQARQTASPPCSAISMGLAGLYGSTAAGAARGLALRMDHGSQYLSGHFTNQIKFWGIQPSYAFVAEPQTNGVAERFNRTLKEQIIHGRIYRIHRGAAGRRPRLRTNSRCQIGPVDRGNFIRQYAECPAQPRQAGA